MSGCRLYGFAVGMAVGAWPFWLVTLVRTARWPGWVALALAVALSATAARNPIAWALGAVAGVLGSWLALAVLIEADWRFALYTVIAAGTYYLVGTVAMLGGVGVLHARSIASGPVRPE